MAIKLVREKGNHKYIITLELTSIRFKNTKLRFAQQLTNLSPTWCLAYLKCDISDRLIREQCNSQNKIRIDFIRILF